MQCSMAELLPGVNICSTACHSALKDCSVSSQEHWPGWVLASILHLNGKSLSPKGMVADWQAPPLCLHVCSNAWTWLLERENPGFSSLGFSVPYLLKIIAPVVNYHEGSRQKLPISWHLPCCRDMSLCLFLLSGSDYICAGQAGTEG